MNIILASQSELEKETKAALIVKNTPYEELMKLLDVIDNAEGPQPKKGKANEENPAATLKDFFKPSCDGQ